MSNLVPTPNTATTFAKRGSEVEQLRHPHQWSSASYVYVCSLRRYSKMMISRSWIDDCISYIYATQILEFIEIFFRDSMYTTNLLSKPVQIPPMASVHIFNVMCVGRHHPNNQAS